jgi:hypothetical protein
MRGILKNLHPNKLKEDTMTPHQESTQQELVSQTTFYELLREKLQEAVLSVELTDTKK